MRSTGHLSLRVREVIGAAAERAAERAAREQHGLSYVAACRRAWKQQLPRPRHRPAPDPMAEDDDDHSDVLRCRCGSVDVQVQQKQTRSADEAMTLFMQCMTCQARWKH